MSKQKHTAPPWHFDGDRTVTSPNRGKEWHYICELGCYGIRLAAEDRANGELIARAPELAVELEAQRPLLAALRAWWNAERAFLHAGGAQSADAADSALDNLKEACGQVWGGERG